MRCLLLRTIPVVLALAALACFRTALRELPRFEPSALRPIGVFHCHAESSHDSRVTLEEIVRIAAQRELDFVVLTDHNSQLAEPREMNGVIVLSYAELSTDFGHVVQLGALGVPSGKERENPSVLSDIRERGGVPILSHPFDASIPWKGPLAEAGGVEIANVSATARRRATDAFLGLFSSLFVYGFHRDMALAQIYDPDVQALALWDDRPDPRFIGLCAVDAHGRIDLQSNLSVWETVLEGALPEEAGARAAAILEALRAGRFHCRSGLFGRPSLTMFARTIDGLVHGQGSSIEADAVEEIVLQGPTPIAGGPAPTLVLMRDGEEVMREDAPAIVIRRPSPGTYRAEVRLSIPHPFVGRRDATVAYSNRIRLLRGGG